MTKQQKRDLILSVTKWTVKNHVRKFGKYWRHDYSSLCYTNERIVDEFIEQQKPKP